jgi:hypothetical protein
MVFLDKRTQYLPVLSLLVAALAVFVGPVITWKIGASQVQSSLKIANKQIVAPMRQAWINDLRNTLAELLSLSVHFYVSGHGDRSDSDYAKIAYLEQKIRLMLNVTEKDHASLEDLVTTLTSSLSRGRDGDQAFESAHTELQNLSRTILKQEWNRVKESL